MSPIRVLSYTVSRAQKSSQYRKRMSQMATFNNTATLSYNGQVTNSNVVTGEIVDAISATKTILDSTYSAGDSLTYVISIINSASTPITGISVTDNLGAYTTQAGATVYPLDYVDGTVRLYSDGVPATAPAVTQGPPVVFSGITVPANGNVILIYEASVNAFAPISEGATITNEASVAGASISIPVTATATALADSEPALTISKSVYPETIFEDGQITYTFVIQNSGNTPATVQDNVVVSDNFDPVLSNLVVTLDGQTLAPTDYTYNAATGEFATTAGAITVPAATFALDNLGRWVTTPGVATLRVTGTV